MKKAIEKLMQLFNINGDQVLLNTAFSRRIVSSLISKAVMENTGVPVEIQVERLGLRHEDGEQVVFHLEISGGMSESSLTKLTNMVSLKK